MGAAAIIVPGVGVPAGRGIPLLADVPDRQSGDGRPQRVVRRKHPMIPVTVLARLGDEIRKPVELAFRRQGHPWPLPPQGGRSQSQGLARPPHRHPAGKGRELDDAV